MHNLGNNFFYSPHTHVQRYYAYNHIFQFRDRKYQHDCYTCMECMWQRDLCCLDGSSRQHILRRIVPDIRPDIGTFQ